MRNPDLVNNPGRGAPGRERMVTPVLNNNLALVEQQQ
jgi:hypothetical protein